MRTIEIPGYTIKRPIDKGGMATVYLAEQTSLARQVAIKVMSEELSKDQSFAERFDQEAKIASRLSHPNIVTIFDYGSISTEKESTSYLVMAFIDGQDLKTLQPKLPLVTRLQVIQDIANALHYAHQQGVIHRDIKPQNILLQKDSHRALLTDFGIAKAHKNTQELTQTGMTLGTPHYMSPEQALGKVIDHRADIYSLGVVLYFLLTGQTPYNGDSEVEIGIKHSIDPIPNLPEIFACFQDIIDKSLAKSPENRYQTAQEFSEAIGRVSIDNLTTLVQSINNQSEAPTQISTAPPQLHQSTKEQSGLNNIKTTVISTVVTTTLLLLAFWFFQPIMQKQDAPPREPEKKRLTLQTEPARAEVNKNRDAIKTALTCQYTTIDTWGNGWQGRISLSNTSSQTINQWRVTFTLPSNSRITNSFVTQITNNENAITLTPHDWNKIINANTTLKLEFQGNGAAPNQLSDLHCNG